MNRRSNCFSASKLLSNCGFALFIASIVALLGVSPNVRADELQRVEAKSEGIPNPKIDAARYQSDVFAAMDLRSTRRLSVEQFRSFAATAGTIILDARTPDKFAMLHVAGAKSLPYTDFTQASLAAVIPSKDTRVLIYCNNNFEHEEVAFTSKMAPAALNLASFTSLYTYGYRNIYELGPVLDPKDGSLQLEGTAVRQR